MNLILQNFLLQLGSLFIGTLGGITLVHLAQEELSLYKKQLTLLFPVLSFATLLAPLLLFLYASDFYKVVPFFVLFFVYGFMFWRVKDKNDDLSRGFFYIVPLTLFLASNDVQVFFFTLSLFLLTVIVFTLSLLSHLQKIIVLESCILLFRKFSIFFLMTLLAYFITFFLNM